MLILSSEYLQRLPRGTAADNWEVRDSCALPKPLLTASSAAGHIWGVGTHGFIAELGALLKNTAPPALDRLLDSRFEEPGAIVLIDLKQRRMMAQSDFVGYYPLFWSHDGTSFAVSDSLRELAQHGGNEPDDIGVLEMLKYAGTVGARTLFKGISRIRPAQRVTFVADSNSIDSSTYASWWERGGTLEAGAAVDTAAELLTASSEKMAGSMLMMSAGWDSRTLLAAALASGSTAGLVLYNHGDMESREAAIVKQIAAATGIRLISRPLGSESFTPGRLAEVFDRTESVMSPSWFDAGLEAVSAGCNSVSSGIYGEIFGGGYGASMSIRGVRKYLALLPALTVGGKMGTGRRVSPAAVLSGAMAILRQAEYQVPWYFNEEIWNDRFRGLHEQVNADLEQVVHGYVDQGAPTVDSTIEAFSAEQRASQSIADQLRTAVWKLPPLVPFAARSLSEFAFGLPFPCRTNNKLCRLVLKRLAPQLLDFPTAAVLVKTKRPVLIQEVSRAYRKLGESMQAKIKARQNDYAWQPRSGWANFQFLRDSQTLFDLIASLNSPLFDQERIRATIARGVRGYYHPLINMLLRMKTIDLYQMK